MRQICEAMLFDASKQCPVKTPTILFKLPILGSDIISTSAQSNAIENFKLFTWKLKLLLLHYLYHEWILIANLINLSVIEPMIF